MFSSASTTTRAVDLVRRAPRRPGLLVLVPCIAALLAAACSSSSTTAPSGTAAAGAGATGTTGTTISRPAGPSADLSQELSGGNGTFLGANPEAPTLDKAGYVQHEYAASGTATSYTAPAGQPQDGHFDLQPGPTADYKTRIVVRRPASPEKFNGTVVVEWLNVSGGVDANPDFTYMADELARGYAWVGVSAQAIGVEGGPVAVSVAGAGDAQGKGLKALDPARYGSLSHPGDAYSYDMFTQVARAVRASHSGGPLGDLTPQRILGVGESQSAFTLTTYVDGVQPLTHAFDGFLLHSRGGAPAPLATSAGGIDIASAISGKPTIVRTDTDVPVMIVETETDVVSILGYYGAQQDDDDRIRLWEVAGTAHADKFQVGSLADSMGCGAPINDGPQRFVIRTALRDLDTWVHTGQAPPKAPRFEVDTGTGKPVLRRDGDGNVLGGIRTAPVDAPVAALTGEPGSANPSVICLLLGSTKPFTDARLAELYKSRQAYLDAFAKATDASITAGFILADDRQGMLDTASPDKVAA